MDPRIRIHNKMSWIRNTVCRGTFTVAFLFYFLSGCVLLLRRAGGVVPGHGPLCAVPPVVPRALSGAPPTQHAHSHGKRGGRSKQCCGSGSESGPFYHYAKRVRKTLIPTVCDSFRLLSLKNDVNVPSESNKQNNFFKISFLLAS
jgi:hypothetical protein